MDVGINRKVIKVPETVYLQDFLSDYKFLLENEKKEIFAEIPAHKAMMVSKSGVIRSSLSRSESQMTVKICANVETFKFFLKYFYNDQNTDDIKADYFPELITLADYFHVVECTNDCVKYLTSTLDASNVLYYYAYADMFNLNDLAIYCEAIIKIHFNEIMKKNDNWSDCQAEIVSKILKFDHFCYEESKILKFCAEWINHPDDDFTNDERKKKIDLKNLIRFKSINDDVILDEYNDLFTPDELIEIRKMINDSEYKSERFTNKTRAPFKIVNCDELYLNSIYCNRLIGIIESVNAYIIQSSESTIFKISRPMLLVSFECCAVRKINEEIEGTLSTKISIYIKEDEKLFETENCLKRSRTAINLTTPIVLIHDVFYTICHELSQAGQYYTNSQLVSNVKTADFDLQFKRHKEYERNADRGLISSLTFIDLKYLNSNIFEANNPAE